MRKIIGKKDKPDGPLTIQEISGQDIVMIGTKQLPPQGVPDAIVIGTIPPGIETIHSTRFEGVLYCNIDRSIINMENFEIVSFPYVINISAMESGLTSGKLRAYIVNTIQDIKEAMADIMSWHDFPK